MLLLCSFFKLKELFQVKIGFEFFGKGNSMSVNSYNESRLPIVLFFKRHFLVLEAV